MLSQPHRYTSRRPTDRRLLLQITPCLICSQSQQDHEVIITFQKMPLKCIWDVGQHLSHCKDTATPFCEKPLLFLEFCHQAKLSY